MTSHRVVTALACVVGCGRSPGSPTATDGRDGPVDSIGSDATPDSATPAPGLPAAFFSLTTNTLGTDHIPSVPFGGLRLWDTSAVWPNLETAAGTYAWGELDAWLAEAQSVNADVIFTFGRTPPWASSDPTATCTYGSGCAAPPSDVAAGDTILKDFVTALVNHSLASPAGHIKYYEIWNEPDLSGTWCGEPGNCTFPDPLVTMGKDITSIVHQLDPDARVLGPSPSTANQFGVHFLPGYYAAGGAPNQDIVGMHGYLYDADANFATVPEGIQTTITQLRELMTNNGVADLPIFFTEGAWGGAPNNASMTDDEKVAYLARDYLYMWMNGIDRFYWYAWDNSTFGTLASGGTIAPSGTAYGILESWLVGSSHDPTNCAPNAISTWICTLTRADQTPAQILWNATATHTQAVDPTFTQYFTLDDTTAHPIVGNSVTVGAKPILVAP